MISLSDTLSATRHSPVDNFAISSGYLFSGRGRMLERTRPRSWMHRDLHRGDLTILTNFAFFRNRYPPSIVVDRLCEGGFLAKTARGRFRMTLKGCIAILLRQIFAGRD